MVPIRQRRSVAVIGTLAPLPVVAITLAFGWPWWIGLVLAGIVVITVAEVNGISVGVLAALVATAGVTLVVERATHTDAPNNGLELLAMAVLLILAVVFGTDGPPPA